MEWLRRRYASLRFQWFLLRRELDRRIPVCCSRCGRWEQKCNMHDALMTSGQWVKLCSYCHTDLNRPWSGGRR